jgi:hypothetical protein
MDLVTRIGRRRRLLQLGLALVLAGLSTGLILLVWGNGITASGLALSCLMLSTALGAFVSRPAEKRARLAWCAGVAGGSVCFLTFIASRLWTEPEPQSFRFVESGRRDAAPPWLSRLVDERETVLTGLRFSILLGMIRGREMEHLDPEMAPLFRGFVLVSGSGEVQTSKLVADVLMLAGSEDQRFRLAYNEGIAEALHGSGAHVETLVLPADHFIWFSHSRQMSDAIEHWVSKR